MTPKLSPEQRRSIILSAAISVANEKGLSTVTFETVSDRCIMKTKPRTVAHYFKINELREAVANSFKANETVRIDAVEMGIL